MLGMNLAQFPFSPVTTIEEKIIFAHTRGFSIRAIKNAFHVGSDKVSATIKYYKNTKTIPQPIPKEAPKLNTRVLAQIHNMIFTDAHVTLETMQKTIAEKFEISIALSTIAKGYAKLKYQYKPPKHKQMLTPKQIADRVSFAYTMVSMFYSNEIDLSCIVFSDESRFVLGDDKRWVWRRRGENNPTSFKKSEKFPGSVMIYGAIGVQYKSKLIFVDGTIDAAQYQQNLIESEMFEQMDSLKGRGQWIFMQDGAPCHTSHDTKAWLGTRCTYISKWPANSPDLNPIENLWGCIKKAVSLIGPKTIEDLKQVIYDVWNNFSQEKIDDLVLSFFSRLQYVILERGESIQHKLRKGMSAQSFVFPQPPESVIYINDIITTVSDEPQVEPAPPPQIDDAPFTKEEDQQIVNFYLLHGTNWKKLARIMKGRTHHQIKNRYLSKIKKDIAAGKMKILF